MYSTQSVPDATRRLAAGREGSPLPSCTLLYNYHSITQQAPPLSVSHVPWRGGKFPISPLASLKSPAIPHKPPQSSYFGSPVTIGASIVWGTPSLHPLPFRRRQGRMVAGIVIAGLPALVLRIMDRNPRRTNPEMRGSWSFTQTLFVVTQEQGILSRGMAKVVKVRIRAMEG